MKVDQLRTTKKQNKNMSTEDKIEVYCLSGSPFVWRVLFYLEERGIKYEAKYLDSSKGENKTPEYLKLNPEGKCPTVVHNGTVIYESMAILEYFDKKFPNSKLTSEKDEELAKQLVTIHDWLSNFKMSRKVFGLDSFPADGKRTDYIFLIDPLGNLMMRYPPDADPSRMKKDIAKLLRVSSGWRQIER